MGQVLRDDQSCPVIVSKMIASLGAHGEPIPSSNIAVHCNACHRLPEELLSDLARKYGRELHEQAPSDHGGGEDAP